MNIALWIIQALLAALFIFAGASKFTMPMEEMTKQMPMPAWFLYFIGICEILGGLGLVLPWWLRIKPGLTPLAAAGLLIIMSGGVAVTLMTPDRAMAVIPAVVGIFLAFVAWGRGIKGVR
ncbi:MAG: DoxX family protein [Deltaproteobacteria bacterium]|nr:DoxX family protein [Deltaproteobacteria bacterium]